MSRIKTIRDQNNYCSTCYWNRANSTQGSRFFLIDDMNPRISRAFVLNEARIPRWCIPIQSDRSRIPSTSYDVAPQSHLPRFDARHCPIRNSGHYGPLPEFHGIVAKFPACTPSLHQRN